jgi:nucleoside-diphosphate-sugar epimerase
MGNALVRQLSASGWTVLAVSRRPLSLTAQNIIPLRLDLTDKGALQKSLEAYSVTHVFFAAYAISHHTAVTSDYRAMRRMLKLLGATTPLIDRIAPLSRAFYTQIAQAGLAYDPEQLNLKMLRNVVEVTQTAPHRLTHVALVTGGKMYGMHLTPYIYRDWRLPFQEEDKRPPSPNFYYDQEDYLKECSAASGITWSVARPAYLIGDNPQAAFSLLVGLAVYASLLKATGHPLIFPGDARAADCLFEMSDADLVAALLEWSSLTPAAHNQAFNAVNGTPLRWRAIWPSIAAYFGMESQLDSDGFSAQQVLREGAPVWAKLIEVHHLESNRLTDLVPVSFFDMVMLQDWDTVFSMEKARRLGFTREVDNMEMFSRHFERLKENHIIP